jgi:hypothetical protein
MQMNSLIQIGQRWQMAQFWVQASPIQNGFFPNLCWLMRLKGVVEQFGNCVYQTR